jgi:4-amino-4-deoxy-L-arabinose transferase-like glycosyltransferase
MTGLFDLDEGYYAAVSDRMIRTGDWIIPTFEGVPWLEKPILVYWITNPMLLAFGDIIGPRLSSVLCSLGTIALIGWFATKMSDRNRGDVAMWVLAGTALFAITGNMLLTDPVMLLTSTAAMLLYFGSLIWQPWLRWFSAATLGLSVLAKGPYPVVVLLVVVAWTYFSEPSFKSALLKGWTRYFGIVAAVCCTWYLPVYFRQPETFVDEFLIRQNLGRLIGGDVAHSVPWWSHPLYYLFVLVVAAAPWPLMLRKVWPKKAEVVSDISLARRWLAKWAIVVFALFTLGGTKLPHYILPTLVPIAILLALGWAESDLPKFSRTAKAMCILNSLGILIFVNIYYRSNGQAEVQRIAITAHKMGLSIATFQLDKREYRSNIQLKMQETLLPSLALYAHQDVTDFEGFSASLIPKANFVLITRPGRLDQRSFDQLTRLGRKAELWNAVPESEKYEAYFISAGDTH